MYNAFYMIPRRKGQPQPQPYILVYAKITLHVVNVRMRCSGDMIGGLVLGSPTEVGNRNIIILNKM